MSAAGERRRLVVAITGASGAIYACKLLERLGRMAGMEVHALISDAGRQVLRLEAGLAPEDLPGVEKWFAADDFTAPMASGSARYHGMVIVPCTTGTLAAIAAGLSRNCIHRAADVMLKERRPLVLAVRETPLGRSHLENMLRVHDAGGIICPAMPAFYHRPADLDDLADQFAGRLLDQLGLHAPGLRRWGGD